MNFEYTRAGGVWSPSTDLLASELADFDDKTTHAISGDGGTYALVDPLIIGGGPGAYAAFELQLVLYEGLYVYGGGIQAYGEMFLGGNENLVVDKFAQFTHLVEFQTGMQVTGDAFFYDEVFCNDDVIIDSSGLLDVYGNADFHQDVTVSGSAHFALTDFSDVAAFYEGVVFQKPITLTGTARIRQRQAIGGNADASYAAQTYTHVHCPAGTLTATRTYTIDDTGAQNGDRMRFSTGDDGQDLLVKSPNGSLMATLNANGLAWWVDVERIQGTWHGGVA